MRTAFSCRKKTAIPTVRFVLPDLRMPEGFQERGVPLSYRALYRVFRPQTFSEIIGQEHIRTTLKNAIVSERLAHAYLFCGPRGTGKTSSAKILAKAVNCLDPRDGEPCNECENCRAINEETFLDVMEIDAASNRGIDEIRELRDKVAFAPSQGKRKVYIIDEVHMLTNEAFNALLKTLEEPPAHVLFILATTEPQKIPLTILSRCQRFDFRKINSEEIKHHLIDIVAEEQAEISDEALDLIVRRAAGGMRDAISVLDQCMAFSGEEITLENVELVLGTMKEDATAKLVDAVLNNSYEDVFVLLDTYVQQGKDVKQILRDLIQYVRDLLLLKVAPNDGLASLSPEGIQKAAGQIRTLSVEELGDMVKELTDMEQNVRYSNYPQILLETTLVNLIISRTRPAEPVPSTPQRTETVQRAAKATVKAQAQPVRKLIASDELISQWDTILKAIKEQSIRLHAFLVEAKPASFENNELILRFPHPMKFHYESAQKDECYRDLSRIIQECVGKPVKVTLEREDAHGNIKQEMTLADEARKIFGDVPLEIKE